MPGRGRYLLPLFTRRFCLGFILLGGFSRPNLVQGEAEESWHLKLEEVDTQSVAGGREENTVRAGWLRPRGADYSKQDKLEDSDESEKAGVRSRKTLSLGFCDYAQCLKSLHKVLLYIKCKYVDYYSKDCQVCRHHPLFSCLFCKQAFRQRDMCACSGLHSM